MMLLVLFASWYASAMAYNDFHWQSYNKMNHFTKRVSPSIYTTGRITDRQIAYMSEANFSTIVSLVYTATDDTVFKGISGNWPSTNTESDLCDQYGLNYVNIGASMNKSSFDTFVDVMLLVPKPVLVHCNVCICACVLCMHVCDEF